MCSYAYSVEQGNARFAVNVNELLGNQAFFILNIESNIIIEGCLFIKS